MRRFPAAILASFVATALLMAGCGTTASADEQQAPGSAHYTFWQEMPDGSEVLCVWAKSGYGGGLSCDWVGYWNLKGRG